MKRKIKNICTEITQTTNEHGELIDQEVKKSFLITEPLRNDSYYSSFIDFLAPYFELKSEKAKDLCCMLCCMAEYNTGRVDISTASRIKICEKMGINNDNLSTYIKMLKEKQILIPDEKYKGVFIINPYMFWKGENKLRTDVIKEIKVEFSIK